MTTTFRDDLFAASTLTVHEQLGFELGWDYAHHGVQPPAPYAQEPSPLRDGLLAGQALIRLNAAHRSLAPLALAVEAERDVEHLNAKLCQQLLRLGVVRRQVGMGVYQRHQAPFCRIVSPGAPNQS